MSQKRDLLSDIVSQKRDLLSDCQKCDIHTDGRTDGVTMRGEGLSCYGGIFVLGKVYKIFKKIFFSGCLLCVESPQTLSPGKAKVLYTKTQIPTFMNVVKTDFKIMELINY